jgi:hypothetical protein
LARQAEHISGTVAVHEGTGPSAGWTGGDPVGDAGQVYCKTHCPCSSATELVAVAPSAQATCGICRSAQFGPGPRGTEPEEGVELAEAESPSELGDDPESLTLSTVARRPEQAALIAPAAAKVMELPMNRRCIVAG